MAADQANELAAALVASAGASSYRTAEASGPAPGSGPEIQSAHAFR